MPSKTALHYNLATAKVLWLRDLHNLWRHPFAVVGPLFIPFVLWWAVATGLEGSFQPAAVAPSSPTPLAFLLPGALLLSLVLGAVFGHPHNRPGYDSNFLRAVRAGPGSDGAFILGRLTQPIVVALTQGLFFAVWFPQAGFSWATIHWPLLGITLLSLAAAMAGFSLILWGLGRSPYASTLIQTAALLPLWATSGALYPVPPSSVSLADHVLAWSLQLNPLAHGLSSLRHALYGGEAPPNLVLSEHPWLECGVSALVAVGLGLIATRICRRRALV